MNLEDFYEEENEVIVTISEEVKNPDMVDGYYLCNALVDVFDAKSKEYKGSSSLVWTSKPKLFGYKYGFKMSKHRSYVVKVRKSTSNSDLYVTKLLGEIRPALVNKR